MPAVPGKPAPPAPSSRHSTAAARAALPFRAVNAPGTPGYRAELQRHHLLPRQLLTRSWFGSLAESLGRERLGIGDFRSNGLLLPALEQAAQVLGLPLHRGPHSHYNQVVIERVGQIEAGWQVERLRNPDGAQRELVMRLRLLQQALRRSLLQPNRMLARLNRRDPHWQGLDFGTLDAMAEALWAASEPSSSSGQPSPPLARSRCLTRKDHAVAGAPDPLAAERIARTLAAATSSSMPTPQMVRPSGRRHSR